VPPAAELSTPLGSRAKRSIASGIMNQRHSVLGALLFGGALVASTGCARRAAPFDSLDKAQLTIIKLQKQAPPTPAPVAQPGLPMIPGIPPEWAALGQQALQQLQQQGLIPPGILPPLGQPGQPAQPTPPPNLFRGQWVIADQRPIADPKLRDQLLDLLGDDGSFNDQRANCFEPGIAFSFTGAPNMLEAVDVVVSFSCNQAVGYGFSWPHPQSGLTPKSYQALSGIYQSQFGPVPPGA
jgi:hypothetical protein